MPRKPRIPSYRLYKPKGLGLVVIRGKQHYLGRYGSPESVAEYNRLIQEFLRDPGAPPQAAPSPDDPSVGDVILAFCRFAEAHYRTPTGEPTGEFDNYWLALRPLRALYGTTPACEFGPLALRAVRDRMVNSGLGRTTVNARVNRIRRVFRWAASVEMVPASVVLGLGTVAGLQEGRCQAPEPPGIGPVPQDHVEAVLPYLPRPVAAMVRLQLLTGCRSGEVRAMRGCDLLCEGAVWEYRPGSHKNGWRGQRRVIPLGPRAQEVIKPFLKADPSDYLFSPREAVGELHGHRGLQRASKRTPSELARRSSSPGRKRRGSYDRRVYRQAIQRACARAGVPGWSPLQLRHTAASAIRAKYGLEAAQAVLGHKRADVTQVYAERDLARARTVMSEIG